MSGSGAKGTENSCTQSTDIRAHGDGCGHSSLPRSAFHMWRNDGDRLTTLRSMHMRTQLGDMGIFV